METVGDRIRKKREELGLTQEELAHKLGYKSRSSVNKMENSRELPLKKVKMMADALECEPSYLVGWLNDILISDESNKKKNAYIINLSNICDILDEFSKKRLMLYAEKLLDIQKDDEEVLNAAHEIENATEEDKKHDDDIMKNDDEWK